MVSKNGQCTYNVTMRRDRVTIVAVKNKLLLNILCVPFYSWISYPSGKLHLFLNCIILSSVTCLALPHFSALSHKWHDFQKIKIKHKICGLIFSTTFVRNISHSKKNSVRYFHKFAYVFM
jgi:hypothetical protein